MPPYLFLLALAAVLSNWFDLGLTYYNTVYGNEYHSNIDYMWLVCIACCNIAPFFAWSQLFETRRDVHAVLRPLLASQSLSGGVKVKLAGAANDQILRSINYFLQLVGHDVPEAGRRNAAAAAAIAEDQMQRIITVYIMDSMDARDRLFDSDIQFFDIKTSLFIWSAQGDP